MNRNQLKGYKWAKQVVNGEFVANIWVKLECRRYIDRIEGRTNKDIIEFDYKECELIYNLLKIINYATGFYAGKPVLNHIAGFQAMIIENTFCWYLKKKDENGLKKRLIEEVYLECGRKSTKSFISGLIELIIMLRSPKYAQTACAGKTRDISNLVKQSTVEIINASPAIKKHFRITRTEIECKLNNATMKALSGEANNINGLLLSSYIVDEVANQENGDIIGALKLSQMNTIDRLSIYISTQYDLEINVFNELIDYHKEILKGVDDDVINTFGLLFELDEGDDFNDMRNWIKASPLQMTFQNGIEFLRGEYRKGLSVPSAMKEFRIKILNERLSGYSGESYLDFDYWKKGRLNKIDLAGKDVIVGMDLSLTTDITAVDIMYRENGKYYLVAHGFLPRNTLKNRKEKFDYITAEMRGECTILDGDIIDYNYIEQYIRDIPKMYNCRIKAIVTDPYNALQTCQNLANDYEVILLKQTYNVLSPPIKDFRNEVYKENVFYQENKLLDWMMVNTETVEGRVSGDILLNKKNKNKTRIDMVVASIFCYSQLYILEDKVILTDDYIKNFYAR